MLAASCQSSSVVPLEPAPARAVADAQVHASTTRLPGGEPLLRMPFLPGTVVFCQQGNNSPPGRTHAYPNALHAVDLSTPGTTAAIAVVAAAAGQVVRVVTGAPPGVALPGGGFGNQVVIDHGEGYRTLYAHLAHVSVKDGQRVESGTPLGTMGESGQAGNVHLHFSLHRAEWPAVGAPETTPMHGLVTADVSVDLELRLLSSLELECADSNLGPHGHMFLSENATGVPPIFGAVAASTRPAAIAARDVIAGHVEQDNPVGAAMARRNERGPQVTRDALRKVLEREPDHVDALYWVAVISLQDLDDVASARAALGRLEPLAAKGPAWVRPWLLVRKAQLAEKDGKKADALKLYREARAAANEDPELATFLADADARLSK